MKDRNCTSFSVDNSVLLREIRYYVIILILLCWKICHMFPMEQPAFPTRNAPIDKRNLFLLSGRAVSRCWHKNLQEKYVLPNRKSNFLNSIYLRKQTFKNQIAQIKLCKENHEVQLSLYISKLSIFSCQLFCSSFPFHYFTFCLRFFFSDCRYHRQ